MHQLTAAGDLHEELEKFLRCCHAENSILVSRTTLRTLLNRFIAGEISPRELAEWATRVEGCDEVQYERGSEKLIVDVIFNVASPEINEPISADLCHRLLMKLASDA
jgi:hypothetical protein